MILKVCTRDGYAWYPGFEENLYSKFSFTIERDSSLSIDDMVWKAFHNQYDKERYGKIPSVLHIVGFEEIGNFHNPDNPPVQAAAARFLVGQRTCKGCLEGWIVPANSSFLLSETGKTIDRI